MWRCNLRSFRGKDRSITQPTVILLTVWLCEYCKYCCTPTPVLIEWLTTMPLREEGFEQQRRGAVAVGARSTSVRGRSTLHDINQTYGCVSPEHPRRKTTTTNNDDDTLTGSTSSDSAHTSTYFSPPHTAVVLILIVLVVSVVKAKTTPRSCRYYYYMR